MNSTNTNGRAPQLCSERSKNAKNVMETGRRGVGLLEISLRIGEIFIRRQDGNFCQVGAKSNAEDSYTTADRQLHFTPWRAASSD